MALEEAVEITDDVRLTCRALDELYWKGIRDAGSVPEAISAMFPGSDLARMSDDRAWEAIRAAHGRAFGPFAHMWTTQLGTSLQPFGVRPTPRLDENLIGALSARAPATGELHTPLDALSLMTGLGLPHMTDAHAARTDDREKHEERVASLFSLVDYLTQKGVLSGPIEDLDVQHRAQKCAYIAQRLGNATGYTFDFLDSGAFSTRMAVEFFHTPPVQAGPRPFRDDTRAEEAFLSLVRERSADWLRVATFAMSPDMDSITRDEFVKHVAKINYLFGERLTRKVFDEVRSTLDRLEGNEKE